MKKIKEVLKQLQDTFSNREALRWLAGGFLAIFLFVQLFEVSVSIKPRYIVRENSTEEQSKTGEKDVLDFEALVVPTEGIVLPVSWGDLGKQMVEAGVIDGDKFETLYVQRGGLPEAMEKLLYEENNGRLQMDKENAGIILNLFWALGLANKNPILDEGPMWDAEYGGDASRFASTGGWTLSDGNTMNHYSNHSFITLTSSQQETVERVSRNIYRPCCGNSTYFPDCNHGMAMLGLLELMAANGVNEQDMYETALRVNSYWFPGTYATIAKYFDERGVSWNEVDAKEILGAAYSSASGYRQILSEVQPVKSSGGGSCGV